MKWNGKTHFANKINVLTCSSGTKGLIICCLALKSSRKQFRNHNSRSLTSFYNYVVIMGHKVQCLPPHQCIIQWNISVCNRNGCSLPIAWSAVPGPLRSRSGGAMDVSVLWTNRRVFYYFVACFHVLLWDVNTMELNVQYVFWMVFLDGFFCNVYYDCLVDFYE